MAAKGESYDAAFYQNQMEGSERAAYEILPLIIGLLQPKSVCDIGCGLGTWLHAAKDLGATKVLGIDGAHVERANLRIDQAEFLELDLENNRIPVSCQFDLAICLEVAEHLSLQRAATFIDDLAEISGTILFSAAIPGQPGTNHINCQWPSFWISMFSEIGFKCYDVVRPQIWHNQRIPAWYRQNILIFSREYLDGLPPHSSTVSTITDVVHPVLWTEKLEQKNAAEEKLRGGGRLIAQGVFNLLPGRVRADLKSRRSKAVRRP